MQALTGWDFASDLLSSRNEIATLTKTGQDSFRRCGLQRFECIFPRGPCCRHTHSLELPLGRAEYAFFCLVGSLIWQRGLRRVPAFLRFSFPWLSWRACRLRSRYLPFRSQPITCGASMGQTLVESLLKFLVIGEVFSRFFTRYPSISRVSRIAVSLFGGALVLLAGLIAGFAAPRQHSALDFRRSSSRANRFCH